MKNNKCFYPRGKVLGGSSSINAGMYVRGNPKDFDDWKDMGNPGWAYEDVLPYFKKSENAIFEDQDYKFHGHDGYWHIDVPSEPPHNLVSLSDKKI